MEILNCYPCNVKNQIFLKDYREVPGAILIKQGKKIYFTGILLLRFGRVLLLQSILTVIQTTPAYKNNKRYVQEKAALL